MKTGTITGCNWHQTPQSQSDNRLFFQGALFLIDSIYLHSSILLWPTNRFGTQTQAIEDRSIKSACD
ncbi:hypothetical protein L596_007445 [Steinernema carpocapsae]|uniref:Uncharacterized protein n=1 Tax=Steinernema carpocapsae TaxID=34508 RepID=A0A4U5P9A1_STECR|nr:hypothetical protein L596_007445 [Steinernema carpocapsae]